MQKKEDKMSLLFSGQGEGFLGLNFFLEILLISCKVLTKISNKIMAFIDEIKMLILTLNFPPHQVSVLQVYYTTSVSAS